MRAYSLVPNGPAGPSTVHENKESEPVKLATWLVSGGLIVGVLGGAHPTAVVTETPLAAIRNVTDWTSSGTTPARSRGSSTGRAGRHEEAVSVEVDLAAAIQRLHVSSGLTWEQLSKLFGVSRRAVHHWAAGGRMNGKHAERVAALTALIRGLPGGSPEARRTKLLAPGPNGRSMYDIWRSATERGEPIQGSPYRPEDLIDAMHDRVD